MLTTCVHKMFPHECHMLRRFNDTRIVHRHIKVFNTALQRVLVLVPISETHERASCRDNLLNCTLRSCQDNPSALEELQTLSWSCQDNPSSYLLRAPALRPRRHFTPLACCQDNPSSFALLSCQDNPSSLASQLSR